MRSAITSALTAMLLALLIGAAATAETTTVIEGIWSGTLEIPNTAKLRMAVTVTNDENGMLTSTLNIIDQKTGEIPCGSTVFENSTLTVRLDNIGIVIEGTFGDDGSTLNSEFRQAGQVFPVALNKVEKVPTLNRPQTPVKPYPYNEEEVTVENTKAGVTLAGTLTTPKSGGPFPAVILLTGSGQQTRDEEIFGHKIFMVLADHLTRNGIAVLRCDDRGIGGSTGDFATSTTGDFADDAIAGVEFLKTHPEIDHSRIGLAGHSEGGMIAPIAYSRSNDISFIVMMAGPGVKFGELVNYQRFSHLKQNGMSDDVIAVQRAWYESVYNVAGSELDNDSAEKEIRKLFAELDEDTKTTINWNEERLGKEIPGMLRPWWRYALAYEPVEYISKIDCPVLAIIGEKDTQVQAKANLPILEKALKKGNRKNVVSELPGLNHVFQTAVTGSEYEYGNIDETMSPLAMNTISDWILEITQ